MPRSLRSLSDVLREGVERGIIDETQRGALEALTRGAPGAEAERGFNAVSVAYLLGAVLVLFAFGWFLVERWEALGGSGVLVVSLVYTALFVGIGMYLRRIAFPTAGNIATLLAVGMTPVTVWALQTMAGLWPAPSSSDPLLRYAPWMSLRWILVELATIGVGLFALRRLVFAPMAAPVAIALAFLGPTIPVAIMGDGLAPFLGRFVVMADGALLLLIAYALDRNQPPTEDYAAWFYAAGLATGEFGFLDYWSRAGAEKHVLIVIGVLLIVAALYLRRRLLLVAGLLNVFWYVGYLGFEVFRKVLNFPVMLATLGLVVIIGTVWAQRRYPALVERVSGTGPRRVDLIPGGYITASAPVLIALVMLISSLPEAKDRLADSEFRSRIMLRREARLRAESRPRPR
jgi:hypothetical protein